MSDTSRYNSQFHHRRSIRLKGYDYSKAGLYFITICTQYRTCWFGEITNVEMILNDSGKMIETEWLALPKRFTNIELHEFVVMPNHFHGILEIVDIVGAPLVGALNMIAPMDTMAATNTSAINEMIAPMNTDKGRPQGHAPTVTPTHAPTNKTVGDMLDAFKSITTVEYIHSVKQSGWKPFNGKIWQRNYYEHIIRDEQSYQTISNYIINNPAKWKDDKFYKLLKPKSL